MTYLSTLLKNSVTSLLKGQRHIHFIGVGGIGMSALALILVKRGYWISGSDQKPTRSLNHLTTAGIKIFKSQNANNINSICKSTSQKPLVVISTAVPQSNPELKAAKLANLQICHRSDILAALIKKQKSILVAGSHGKTTTSTFLTTLLAKGNQDPTAIIGGIIPHYQSNAHAGSGEILVAEADESDGSLVKFQAQIGLITNLELDHTDHYNNLKDLIKTMQFFSKNCKHLLANYDCLNVRNHIQASAWWSVKTSDNIDFSALPIKIDGNLTIADIYEKGRKIDQITLTLPGIHNLSNTIAAIGACRIAGIPFSIIRKNLPYLKTPGRRFEFRGIWNGRQIVDDYAHHPSEVNITLKMANLIIQSGHSPLPKQPKRLVVVFQPHRYSRLKNFLKDFALALGKSDIIIITPVYSAGEIPIKDINSKSLSVYIKAIYPNKKVFLVENFTHLSHILKTKTLQGDLILTMGAGDINNLWEKLKNHQRESTWLKSNLAA